MRRMILIGWMVIFVVAGAVAQGPGAVALSDTEGRPAYLRLHGDEASFVVVFLSPECPLCQNYTAVLNKLAEAYKGKVAVYGIIPGKSYSAEEGKKFQGDYKISFGLLFDRRMRLCRLLKATITPQAFLVEPRGKVLYSGLIDNWAASLGVQRTVVTRHYLADAIDASLRGEAVNPRSTKPVGCLINTY